MLDVIFDGLFDTLKLLPYLFITFILLEMLEHKISKKNDIDDNNSNSNILEKDITTIYHLF